MSSAFFTKNFIKQFEKLTGRDQKLKKQLAKQISFFEQDRNHPSLRTHKLKGNREQQYSIWIKSNLRAICNKAGDEYIFFELINHDQY